MILLQVADFSWAQWHAHPSIILGLLAFGGAYLLGVGPLRQRYRLGPPVEGWRVSVFLLGVLVLMVALLSPIHDLGERFLFSFHMLQHMLLMLVFPPLALIGTPPWLLKPFLRNPTVRQAVSFVTRPVAAFLIFNTVLVFWHVPGLYDLALRERNIHILEHVTFMGAAVLMWWPVLSPMHELPRAPYIGQMAYLFMVPTVSAILGAFITFSESVWYDWYAEAPRIWEISAKTDQEIGGLLMWVPGGVVFMASLIIVFLVWAGKSESDDSAIGAAQADGAVLTGHGAANLQGTGPGDQFQTKLRSSTTGEAYQ